ncbi:MAG: hypothetical protein LBC94_10235 [Desulfovibrio sp.]|jgi:hypothetical protein|nr:hypothetical protein [Desulfovibrio sp.]
MAEQIGPVLSANIVLGMLGRKVAAGQELTMAETLMAFTEMAKTRMDSYGPSPANMQIKLMPLPEDVRGVLANYTGV